MRNLYMLRPVFSLRSAAKSGTCKQASEWAVVNTWFMLDVDWVDGTPTIAGGSIDINSDVVDQLIIYV